MYEGLVVKYAGEAGLRRSGAGGAGWASRTAVQCIERECGADSTIGEAKAGGTPRTARTSTARSGAASMEGLWEEIPSLSRD